MVDTAERDECATEGCHRAATEYFERGGVGSRYCADCATLVRQLSHPMTPKEVEDVVGRLEEHQGIGAALSGSGRFVCSLMDEAASLLRTQAEELHHCGAALAQEVEDRLHAEAQLSTAQATIERYKEAGRQLGCPRPCNHRPDEFTVGECIDAGECGCVAHVFAASSVLEGKE